MKRRWFVVGALAITASGCGGHPVSKADFDALQARVATLEAEHTKTRNKLSDLLKWINHKQPPELGLYDWIDKVTLKLWAPGTSDPVKPPPPPPDF